MMIMMMVMMMMVMAGGETGPNRTPNELFVISCTCLSQADRSLHHVLLLLTIIIISAFRVIWSRFWQTLKKIKPTILSYT